MRVAVITMQKNETALLPAWVRYHGRLFGFKNLYIFDNGSTDAVNKNSLELASTQGVNVDYSYNKPKDFEDKGIIISKLINEIMDKYDFFVPADVDEFLALTSEIPMSHTAAELMSELDRLAASTEQFIRISQCYYNLAHTTLVRPGITRKLVVKSGPPILIDEGYHLFDWSKQVDTTPSGRTEPSSLAHVHFHRKDYVAIIKSAREKLKLRVPNFRASTMEQYTGHATHLKGLFDITPDSYEKWTDRSISIADSWARWNIGPVPYSESKEVISNELISDLFDPVNLYHIVSKGIFSISELEFIDRLFRKATSSVHYGLNSLVFLACERGLKHVHVIEPDIAIIQSACKDSEMVAYVVSGRLAITSPFRNDLRMRNAPKPIIQESELLEAFSPITEEKNTVFVFSGRLAVGAALKWASLDTENAIQGSRAVMVVSEGEQELPELSSACDIVDRCGSIVELRRSAEKAPYAESAFRRNVEGHLSSTV